MDLAEICAILVGEPYHLRPWEILKLDRWWVSHVYLRPREPETGSILIRDKAWANAKGGTEKETFWKWCRSWGYPESLIETKWANRGKPKSKPGDKHGTKGNSPGRPGRRGQPRHRSG